MVKKGNAKGIYTLDTSKGFNFKLTHNKNIYIYKDFTHKDI